MFSCCLVVGCGVTCDNQRHLYYNEVFVSTFQLWNYQICFNFDLWPLFHVVTVAAIPGYNLLCDFLAALGYTIDAYLEPKSIFM